MRYLYIYSTYRKKWEKGKGTDEDHFRSFGFLPQSIHPQHVFVQETLLDFDFGYITSEKLCSNQPLRWFQDCCILRGRYEAAFVYVSRCLFTQLLLFLVDARKGKLCPWEGILLLQSWNLAQLRLLPDAFRFRKFLRRLISCRSVAQTKIREIIIHHAIIMQNSSNSLLGWRAIFERRVPNIFF